MFLCISVTYIDKLYQAVLYDCNNLLYLFFIIIIILQIML